MLPFQATITAPENGHSSAQISERFLLVYDR